MMELQWGGQRRERRVKIFFALKNGWWFARVQMVGAASNNKPTRGRLREGCWLHVSPSKAVSLQD
jgi:hypothetical protein